MEVCNRLVDIAVDDPHPVEIELGDFFIKKQSELVVVCLGEGQVLEGLDVFVEQTTVTSINGAHAVRRIQSRDENHDGKRQKSDQDFCPDFEVCQETHLGHPSPMPQPTSVISKGVGRSLLRKLGRWKLAELSVWRKPSYFQVLPIRRGRRVFSNP